jgi:uncharacterized protein YdaU (DUF1376 family)
MSWFPRPVGPRAAIADLLAFMRQRSREQVIAASLSVLVTAIIVFEFFIVYAESWSANRTDAEIIADQKKHQQEREAALKERQRQFKKLEKQLGME